MVDREISEEKMGTMKETPGGSKLRQRAEKELETAAGNTETSPEISPEKMKALIHELRVHQIELQMQNDELRRIQDDLEKTRDKYSHLYDFAPIGYFTVDQKGTINEANLTIASMLGLDRSALIGRPFSRFILRDDQDTFYKHRQRLLETEVPQSCELRLVKKDGDAFYAHLECTVITKKGDDDKQIRAAVNDITVRKGAEEALRKSELRYRTMLEQAADAVFVHNETGRIVDLNQKACQNLGYSREELLSMSIGDIDPEAIQTGKHDIWGNILAGEHFTFESRHMCKDGKFLPIEVTLGPVDLDEGLAILSIVRDITERKRLESQLQQSQKMEAIGTLTGGIAHDYNNLMSIVMGNLSMAMEEVEPGSHLKDFLHKANMASHKVRDLTHQLMALSRGGAPVKEVGSLKELVKSVLDVIPGNGSILLKESIYHDLWLIAFDSYKMGAVIRNVVTNAVEAMPDGGTITIHAQNRQVEDAKQDSSLPLKPGDYVHISIQDQGMGIPQEHLDKIFDPYFSTKAMGMQKGMGLGLTTAYAIVQKHGGHIAISSSPGVGTTVNIYLPAERQAAEADNTIPAEEDSAFPIKRVLVMDDEEMLRNLARQMLERMGFTVETVKDGFEAIEAYQKQKDSGEPFAAVILDLTIKGGMGGEQAMRELLKIDPHIKAIVSSGYSNDPVMSDFEKCGFMGAMAKPYENKALKEVLQGLFE